MRAEERRKLILEAIRESETPVSATVLAMRFGVSRQVVVGDVALLRAGGENVSATPRGYIMEADTDMSVRTIACVHDARGMRDELNIMVDNGCIVRDVIVEHPIYGQLTGALNLRSRYDVTQFIVRNAQSSAAPLSALTDGVHLHTLLCPDEESFRRVCEELKSMGLLLEEQDT